MTSPVSMSDAEFRMTREHLGLSGEDVAERLRVSLRTVRRWEHGHSPIPAGVVLAIRQLEDITARRVTEVAAGIDPGQLVLTIPRDGGYGWPATWWRAVAARCVEQVPGLSVRYSQEGAPR